VVGVKVAIFIGLLFASFVVNAKCPVLSEARSLYLLGRTSLAVQALECRRQHDPNDVESLRLLSDIYWWTLESDSSLKVAQEGVQQATQTDLTRHFYRRQARLRLSSDYQFTDGIQGRVGHEMEGRVAARYWRRNEIEGGFRQVGRAYRDRALSYDSVWMLSHQALLTPFFALGAKAEYSRHPSFTSEWLLSVTSQVYWKNYEGSLEILTKKYPSEWSFGLRPTLQATLGEHWILGARLDLNIKPQLLASAEGFVDWTLLPPWGLRLAGGGGKVDEGQGLVDEFYQGSVRLSWDALKWLRLRTVGSLYRGDLREEIKVGGGFECFF